MLGLPEPGAIDTDPSEPWFDFTVSYKLDSEMARWVFYFKVPGNRESISTLGNPPGATTNRSNPKSDVHGAWYRHPA